MRFIEEVHRNDSVCSEMSEPIAQLTPSSKESYGVCIADDDRPHNPFRLLPGFVSVLKTQLPSGTNPGPGLRKVEPVPNSEMVLRCPEGRLGDKGMQRSGDCGGDLRE